ncbi:MAG TPA: glycosyltransferase [Candidatus Paceibacterota bacterium]|nr:glycosyltransferase [Candidatus Paceibacterota bacterium]
MKISVIIPAFNEEMRIVPTLTETAEFLKKNDIDSEIIVVDDGSIDATEFVSNETLSKQSIPYKVMRHVENRGKGAAVATGIKHSKGDLILFLDADGSTSIREIERFYEYIDPANLIIGSRRLDKTLVTYHQEKSRKFIGSLATIFHKVFFRLGVEDTQCGFKLLPKSLAISFVRKAYPKGWGFDIALIHYARKCGFNVIEVGVEWRDVPGSKVRLVPDSFKTIFELIKYRMHNFFH